MTYILEVVHSEHVEAQYRTRFESNLSAETLIKIFNSVSNNSYSFDLNEYGAPAGMNVGTLEEAISEVQQLKLVVAAYALKL